MKPYRKKARAIEPIFEILPIEVIIYEIFPYLEIDFWDLLNEKFLGHGYFIEDKTRKIYWLWKSLYINFKYLEDTTPFFKTKEVENLRAYYPEENKFFGKIQILNGLNEDFLEMDYLDYGFNLITEIHKFRDTDKIFTMDKIKVFIQLYKHFDNVRHLKFECSFIQDLLMTECYFPNLESAVFVGSSYEDNTASTSLEVKYKKPVLIPGLGWRKENLRNLKKVEVVNGFINLTNPIFRNELFYIYCLTKQFNLIDESLRKDRSFVLKAIKQNYRFFKYLDKSFKNDKEIILEAMKKGWEYELEQANESLKKDKQFVLEAVRKNGFSLQYTHESLKKDKQIVLEAVKNNGHSFEYAHEQLKKDKRFILETLEKNSNHFQYAHESLKKDKRFIIEAVKQNGESFQYVHESLKKDKDVALEAVKQNGISLEYAHESLKKDKQIVLAAVRKNGLSLQYAHESFKNDKQIVLEAVRNGFSLQYVHESFKKDKDVVLEAVKHNGFSFEYAHESLKKDKEVAIEAMKISSQIQYVDDSLKKDKEFIKEAFKKDNRHLRFAHHSLLMDMEFLKELGFYQ